LGFKLVLLRFYLIFGLFKVFLELGYVSGHGDELVGELVLDEGVKICHLIVKVFKGFLMSGGLEEVVEI